MLTRLIGASLAALGLLVGSASAQTSLKFTLDFIMFGPNSPFVFADEGGYFKDAGLSVRVDPSSGSGDAVNRLASGAYDIGYADVGTVIEFAAKNPDIAPKVVLFIQDRTPATILALKKAGIAKPADLVGHTLASGSTDAGARLFPTFARINSIDVSKINRQIVDFGCATACSRRESSTPSSPSPIPCSTCAPWVSIRPRSCRLDYADHGLNFYGNAMIASRQILASNPQAVRGAVEAVAKAWRDAVRNPKPVIDALVKRNNLSKPEADLERLEFIIRIRSFRPSRGRTASARSTRSGSTISSSLSAKVSVFRRYRRAPTSTTIASCRRWPAGNSPISAGSDELASARAASSVCSLSPASARLRASSTRYAGRGRGGLRPPFLTPRTPMRRIGYGEGEFPACSVCGEPPHPPVKSAGDLAASGERRSQRHSHGSR